ncbi:radical SAM family heme chaperone HemW [Pedobacter insulae]|uniref:Heme chaperone HemW n=1 Tax=Pedobacter insulae TaxID=414048 RepID=A0A1I2TG58_9SPHI|nr:radical SAM family heme chaperone HemW [Pedobacter insulae]SFG63890.1 oxygen-independent coproporphyrinogen-3 oxidase [Pedobacter insulae]
MAGIYIHIPFCKKACTYCDFHFSTSLKYADEMVDAICKEIMLKKDRLLAETIESIYFGGGTPSVLPAKAYQKIFDTLTSCFTIASAAEITMEANPDDLDGQKITALKQLPINRFSIGIQSFFEEDLVWMNRAHTAIEAESCIKRSQDAGFENLSIDLIYGYPLLTDPKWLANIQQAIELKTPHISAYSLTVEPRTALAAAIKKGQQTGLDDEQSAAQFLMLNQHLTKAGFEHYEISNYSMPGCYAVHNTNYWRGVPYLGIGPSAHGFNGTTRYLNVANNAQYLAALNGRTLPETIEELSITNQFNEYIMTALRTQWGVDLTKISTEFGQKYTAQTLSQAAEFIENGKLIRLDNKIILSETGKLFADGLAVELFTDDDDNDFVS